MNGRRRKGDQLSTTLKFSMENHEKLKRMKIRKREGE